MLPAAGCEVLPGCLLWSLTVSCCCRVAAGGVAARGGQVGGAMVAGRQRATGRALKPAARRGVVLALDLYGPFLRREGPGSEPGNSLVCSEEAPRSLCAVS